MWCCISKCTLGGYQPGCSEVTSPLPSSLLPLLLTRSLGGFFSLPLASRLLHFRILHFFLWMLSGQWSPPNWGSSFTMRVRIVWPLPQDLLHSDHSLHSDITQSMAEETELERLLQRVLWQEKTDARVRISGKEEYLSLRDLVWIFLAKFTVMMIWLADCLCVLLRNQFLSFI